MFTILVPLDTKQRLLEIIDIKKQFYETINILSSELEILQVEKDIEEIKIDTYHMKGDMQHMKGDMLQTKNDIKSILNGMDAEAKQLDIIRSEQAAFAHSFNRFEKESNSIGGKGAVGSRQ